MNRLLAKLSIAAGLALVSMCSFAQSRNFVIFDKQQYRSDQLEAAASSPVQVPAAIQARNGGYLLPRATDGHYYITGAVNGFPTVFMVDTGATQVAIPTSVARNAGIRAGEVRMVNTANGTAQSIVSTGNKLVIGPFSLSNVPIGTTERLETPLLGMAVLDRFSITTDDKGMLLTPRR